MAQKTAQSILQNNKLLGLGVLLLWSLGRVLTPLTVPLPQTSSSPFLFSLVGLYILLHICLLGYTFILVGQLLRHSKRAGSRYWSELGLYGYVCIALLLSLYFLAFEYGYVPPFVSNALVATLGQ